jgi:pimeloyl-ACP methyl ester carboxylesterase
MRVRLPPLGITLGISSDARRDKTRHSSDFNIKSSDAGDRLDAPRAKPQSWRMVDFSTSVIAVRGCRIRLMRGGAGDPLIYLHGASGAAWLPFLQALAQKYDVMAPEHPGFGESDTPDWLDNIHDLAYFYLDLFDELKLKSVHLVGNSLGGWIAAELAVRNTQRLASLTLAGSAGLDLPGVKQMDSFLTSDQELLRQFFYDPKKADAMIARVLDPKQEDVALRNQATVAKLVWQPRSHDPHLGKWLHRIDVPTLLIWGDHDRMFPKEHALAFQKAIPGAKLVIVPECGHVPQIEKPDAFVAALENFLGARKKAA